MSALSSARCTGRPQRHRQGVETNGGRRLLQAPEDYAAEDEDCRGEQKLLADAAQAQQRLPPHRDGLIMPLIGRLADTLGEDPQG